MASTGYLQVHAYTSYAQLPLRDVSIVITAPDRTVIAMRLTDRSGLTGAIEIPTPDESESQSPGTAEKPYTNVNLYARAKGYEPIVSEDIQIFADTLTYQDLEMIPLSEFPNGEDDSINYDTPPQNL